MEGRRLRIETGNLTVIEIYDWHQSIGENIDILQLNELYDVAFTGCENLDDRSDWSSTFLKRVAKKLITVEYSHSTVSLAFDDTVIPYRENKAVSYIGKRVLIDSTSLSFPELMHLFLIFERDKQPFDVVYVQPQAYQKDNDEKGLSDVETFSLSDDGIGPKQLQPFVNYSSDIYLTICLGFEGHRFGALINSEEYNISELSYVLGVPAFKVGWENKTLANNYKVMMDVAAGVETNLKIAPANDPVSIYEAIDRAYRSSTYSKKTFFLAPFGTKPAAIAAAAFAVNKKKLVVIYDFVKKKKQRSSGTDLVHLWRFRNVP
jgi:hypothetical protein